jgi:hypothetical protein
MLSLTARPQAMTQVPVLPPALFIGKIQSAGCTSPMKKDVNNCSFRSLFLLFPMKKRPPNHPCLLFPPGKKPDDHCNHNKNKEESPVHTGFENALYCTAAAGKNADE